MIEDYFSSDISDFLRICAGNGVRYCIVGGEAVIYHGFPRFTGDIDIFYDSNIENVSRLQKALEEFWGGPPPNINVPKDFLSKGMIIQFGVPPNRIDLLNSIDGVSFDEAWTGKSNEEIIRETGRYSVYFIGKTELIKNKQASGRYKDLEDLKYLL